MLRPGEYARPVQHRHALGALFFAIALVFGLIAVAAAQAGQWVIGAAALALALWMGSTSLRALRRKRSRS